MIKAQSQINSNELKAAMQWISHSEIGSFINHNGVVFGNIDSKQNTISFVIKKSEK